MLKDLFTLKHFLRSFGKVAFDYKWEELVRDQWIMAEASIKRNLLPYADEVIFLSHCAYNYLQDYKYTDKEAWIAIINIVSNIHSSDFEDDFSLQSNKHSLQLILQGKMELISYALDKYSSGASSSIFNKENIIDKVINTSLKHICDDMRNELKMPVQAILKIVKEIKKYIPLVKKILKRADWYNNFKLILEDNKEVSLHKKNAFTRHSELKQLASFINEVENLGLFINVLYTSYNKALDSTCAYIKDKMEVVYGEIKSKLEEQYDENEIAAFCEVYSMILKQIIKQEVSSAASTIFEKTAIQQFRILRHFEYLVHYNISEPFKSDFEKVMQKLDDVPYYDQFDSTVVSEGLYTVKL